MFAFVFPVALLFVGLFQSSNPMLALHSNRLNMLGVYNFNAKCMFSGYRNCKRALPGSLLFLIPMLGHSMLFMFNMYQRCSFQGTLSRSLCLRVVLSVRVVQWVAENRNVLATMMVPHLWHWQLWYETNKAIKFIRQRTPSENSHLLAPCLGSTS